MDLAWVAYILFTAATMLTHNTAILFFGAVNLYVLGHIWFRRHSRRYPREHQAESQALLSPPSLANWIAAQLGVLLLWSPWLKPFIVQAAGVDREFWLPAPTWTTVLEAIQNLLNAFLPARIERLGILAGAIWSVYAAIVVLGVVRLRKRPARLVLLCALTIAPFAGELLVSLRRPIFYERTLIWASIPLYLLLATGIRQLRYRSYVLTALAILTTVNLFSVREYHLHFEKEQWDDAAAYVAQHAEDKDLVLFNATWVQIPFDFYFQDFQRSVEEHGVPVDLFDRGVLEPKMAASDLPRLRTLIQGRRRVWLIYSHHWYTDSQSLIPATLEDTLHLLERRRFYGLEVRLYGVPSAK